MAPLLMKAVGGDPEALQAAAAFVAIVAIIPSAILFIINQWHQNGLLRNEKHRYIIERYHMFLEKCLEHPQLRLQDDVVIPKQKLSADDLYQRDILFDLLTSIFELAYVSYANRLTSNRARQWGGWEAYIDFHMSRADYREWWFRVMLDDDRSGLEPGKSLLSHATATQYDLKFERFMFTKLEAAEMAAAAKKPRRRKTPGTRGAQNVSEA